MPEQETEFPSIIYKAPLDLISEDQVLLLPNTAKILAVDVQGPSICIWFQWYQHPDNLDSLQQWRFRVIATGQRFQASEVTYRATVQMKPYVWHIYQVNQQ